MPEIIAERRAAGGRGGHQQGGLGRQRGTDVTRAFQDSKTSSSANCLATNNTASSLARHP